MNRRPTLSFTLLVAVALLAAGCSGGGASPSAVASVPASAASVSPGTASSGAAASDDGAASERVRLSTSGFDPTELTIAAGTEVVFVNAASFDHTVTEGTDGQAVEDPIVDDNIAPNGTVRVVFDEPGTYQITCRIHPSMHLTVTVTG